MKKILILSVLFAALSCRSDSKDSAETTNLLIGKWSWQKVDLVKSTDGQTETQETHECLKKSIYEFQEKKQISTIFEFRNAVCVETETITKNYTVDKKEMKFWYENEQNYPYYITKLNSTELVIEDRTQDFDGDNKPDILRRYFIRTN